MIASEGHSLRTDVSGSRHDMFAQAARVVEPDFTVAAVRLGIDFSILRISSAKMPDVAT